MFLAVDTVFDQCSVAIVNAEQHVLSCHTQPGKREQTQLILPMIESALAEAKVKLEEVTALIFNRGPGPFSGIRINTAVVQALSVAHDIPCVGVSSLAAIAQAAFEEYKLQQVYVAFDARMKQVYFAQYQLNHDLINQSQMNQGLINQNQLNKPQTNLASAKTMVLSPGAEEQLLDYDHMTELGLPIVGNGSELLQIREGQDIYSDIAPNAVTLAKLGVVQYLHQGGVAAEQALPVYLRNDAWKTLKEQGKS